MNLFDYLKWRTERKEERKRIAKQLANKKKEEKLVIHISTLEGKAKGLREKAEIYAIANNELRCSNYDTQSEFIEKAAIIEGEIQGLKFILSNLRMEKNDNNH